MKKLIALIALLLLAGCDSTPATTCDQCLRARLFQECLERVPQGPPNTVYNDWSEVVDSCADAAYYQSLRAKESVLEGCK